MIGPGDLVRRPERRSGTRRSCLVFDVLPTPYVVLTRELGVADVNRAYLDVTGRGRDELIGQYFLTAFPPPSESIDATA